MNDSTVHFTDTLKYNTVIPYPTEPNKTGHIFDCWSTDNVRCFKMATMPDCNVTLYVKWDKEVNDNDEMNMSKRDQILDCFNSSSYTIKPKIGRRFHKVQIFNNYKPFLVDDFREYAKYE